MPNFYWKIKRPDEETREENQKRPLEEDQRRDQTAEYFFQVKKLNHAF